MVEKAEIQGWFEQLQAQICAGLEQVDGAGKFGADYWERAEGGGGCTRVINGEIIEKGGVAFSAVHGKAGANMIKTLQIQPSLPAEQLNFLATGVSIVLHPKSPRCPIIHMNVRYFELSDGTWWFGGGIDLSPHYINEDLARLFHQRLKNCCEPFGADLYPKYKRWADEYFHLKHRGEARGVGGIFFDRLNEQGTGLSKQKLWEFVQSVGQNFVPAYAEQIAACKDLTYGEKELHWQSLRRSRYVEFNLVWDRGTHFGLQTNGRTESILMSMPPQAIWLYDYQPAADSEEAQTLQLLKSEQRWLGV